MKPEASSKNLGKAEVGAFAEDLATLIDNKGKKTIRRMC